MQSKLDYNETKNGESITPLEEGSHTSSGRTRFFVSKWLCGMEVSAAQIGSGFGKTYGRMTAKTRAVRGFCVDLFLLLH